MAVVCAVLVDQPAASGVSLDLPARLDLDDVLIVGSTLVEGAVGTVVVVVLDVLDE
jgi:hypothetical protein